MSNNNIIPKEFKLSKYNCRPMIGKNGTEIKMSTFRSSLIEYYDLLCLINRKRKMAKLNFPQLLGLNNKIILKKLKVIYLAKHTNLLYFIYMGKYGDLLYLFFRKENSLRVFIYIKTLDNFLDFKKKFFYRKRIKTKRIKNNKKTKKRTKKK